MLADLSCNSLLIMKELANLVGSLGAGVPSTALYDGYP